MITADVARGDGQDYSVFHVFKLETAEVVAEYQGKVAPDIFANILCDAGKEYGNCMIVVENNTVGWTVLDKLQEFSYPNIFYSYKSSHEYVDPLIGERSNSAVMGFSMTSKTRPLVIAKLEEFVRNKLVTIYSTRTYNEMKTFVWHSGRPQAMRGYNDDLVMAFAIGCWVKDIAFEVNQKDMEYKKAFLNCMKKSDTIINTRIRGQHGYKEIIKDDEKRKYLDHIWLLKG